MVGLAKYRLSKDMFMLFSNGWIFLVFFFYILEIHISLERVSESCL